MTMKYTTLIVLSISLFLLNCTDDDVANENASISGSVAHHEQLIPNAIVFYKFDATELPGTSEADYDGSVIADSINARYEITGLKAGNYYLYAVGTDTSCKCEVKGGIPVFVPNGDDAITSNVPVTE